MIKRKNIVLVDARDGSFVAYGVFNLHRGQLTPEIVDKLKTFMLERNDKAEKLDLYVGPQKVGQVRWKRIVRLEKASTDMKDFIEVAMCHPKTAETYVRNGRLSQPELIAYSRTGSVARSF